MLLSCLKISVCIKRLLCKLIVVYKGNVEFSRLHQQNEDYRSREIFHSFYHRARGGRKAISDVNLEEGVYQMITFDYRLQEGGGQKVIKNLIT